MLIFLLLLHLSDPVRSATDFENARISSTPKLICSKKSISVFFETNIPFQGRISVMRKMYIPECNLDYSTNILRNATFRMDIDRCTETTYMTNGSRILTAHLEIGFHPLVITSSDRVYSIQCIDNSYAAVKNRQPNVAGKCTHVVRSASKFEGVTVFHVGDAVVHEWNCLFDTQELGTVQVFLTSCNAISQAAQVIHLVDENGCVVDSELMGDLVYNNNTAKIYARAKVFKLMNGERYRIECSLQMCRKDMCMNRPYPPKCAFTKDEILSRYKSRVKHSSGDTLMTGGINNRFEKEIKVSSEWMTVHYNQYTNVDQLHERYFINSVMDPTISEELPTTMPTPHFLMGISYKEPGKKGQTDKERTNDVPNPVRTELATFQPQNNPVIFSSEENQIETISEDLAAIMPIAKILPMGPVTVATTTEKVELSKSAKFSKDTNTATMQRASTLTTTKPSVRINTTRTPVKITTNSTRLTTTSSAPKLQKQTLTTPTATIVFNRKVTKPPIKGNVATMKFYTETPTTFSTTTTTKLFSTTETPFKQNHEIFTKMFTRHKSTSSPLKPPIHPPKESFVNPRDWRLDDRTINDTDIFSDKQVACSNNSTSVAAKRCVWSGLDHLLIVWSFGSALVWIVMLAVCFYRNSRKRPDWVAYREKEMKRLNRVRVLPQEHPWLHADAFEEPKLRKKHEIDMSKF